MAALTQVPVAAAPLERFRSLIGEDYAPVEEAMEDARRLLTGRVIWHVNSTARGGGVAELLQSLLAYARGAGVDVRWMTIGGDEHFFRLTKLIHNNLHGSPGDGGSLDSAARAVYEGGLQESATELMRLVRDGDIVYLHDPQTAGLISHAKAGGVRVIWRCHVGVDTPNDLTREAWDFLRRYVDEADAYVFSRREFVWDGLDADRVWIVPPSIDPFSPKNQDLEPGAVRAIFATAGLAEPVPDLPMFERHDGSAGRVDRAAEINQDRLVPWDAPLVTQVSRWDRLKDPVGVLRCFAGYVEGGDTHLLLAGPSVEGVADDPEGAEVLEETRRERDGLSADVRGRVHLASLPMDDIEENAAMVNAIQRRAEMIVQKSLAEGFGLTVAEAMWKGRPVVAGRVGGIQDQIVDGESGLLVDDPADLAEVGALINSLLGDPVRARAIGAAARDRVLHSFLGTRSLVQYMSLLRRMLE
jgi:trehalose synthase